jgi:hypothetical protein
MFVEAGVEADEPTMIKFQERRYEAARAARARLFLGLPSNSLTSVGA